MKMETKDIKESNEKKNKNESECLNKIIEKEKNIIENKNKIKEINRNEIFNPNNSNQNLSQDENMANEVNENEKSFLYLINEYKCYIISIIVLLIAIFITSTIFMFEDPDQLIIEECMKLNKKIIENWTNWENNYKDINKENLKKEINKKVIVGIDFGSSYSGYSFIIDLENEIKTENLFNYMDVKDKEPTVIVFERNNTTFHSYGENANRFMKNDRDKFDNYVYFNRIKTNLDPNSLTDDDLEIYIVADKPKNYKILLKQVISEYLRGISNDALNSINYKNHDFKKDDIKWVITVPAIWNEYGKQLMRKCAQKAGMNNVDIALEPEAASLTMFYDTNLNSTFKQVNKTFLLVDVGGYTVDITLNKILDKKGNLKQLSPPSGGPYGSTNINKALVQLINETIGEKKIDKLIENNYADWKEILDTIESKKINFQSDSSDSSSLIIKTKPDFNGCPKNQNKKCIKKTSFGNITFDNYIIDIPRSIIEKIIYNIVLSIIHQIKLIFEKYKDIKIDIVILTGGFSDCYILRQEIKKNYPNFHILMKPKQSVMKGAVFYGKEPNTIVSRKIPYTIGIECQRIYNDSKVECKEPKIVEGILYCSFFCPYIKIGDDITNNQNITDNFSPLYQETTKVNVKVYTFNSKDPLYVDENNLFASFELKTEEIYLPQYLRTIEITMEFGSCITVYAKNVVSGKTVRIIENYYKGNYKKLK